MDKLKNYNLLKELCRNEGLDLFGVADIKGEKEYFALSPKVIEKLDYAICLGISLSRSILEEITNSPTRLYFHHYRAVNAFLDHSALKLSNLIQKKGLSALPVPASQILDWDKHKSHLSHKKIGILAGLGWIGRNNLLVNKKFGSQFRLVSILTDMPLKADKPLEESCGACRACISVCPAQAIKESASNFEHIKCYEKLKEFQRPRQIEQFVCGVCVNVCRGKK